jgi:hypothetical protein
VAVPLFQLPAPDLRPLGLFEQTAYRIPWVNRYAQGVTFQPYDFTDLTLDDIPADLCATEGDLAAARECLAWVTQTGFNVIDQYTGQTREEDEASMRENIAVRWERLISEAFARELLAGAGGSNHNLTTDAEDITGGGISTVRGAIAELEEVMARGTATSSQLGNTLGMIHMTPSALVYAVTNGTISYNNGRYFSPGGHRVVADAGYQVTETTTTDLYGTGPVYWALGERQARMDALSDGMSWSSKKNTLLWVEQAMGIILYAPDSVWKATATKA